MAAALRLAGTVKAYQSVTEGDGFYLVDRLERQILDHNPRSGSEAALMLEIVAGNLAVGGRSDGRDVQAVKRIIGFLTDRVGSDAR